MLVERGAEVHAHDAKGYTPLHFAASHGQMQATRVLVTELGANIDACDQHNHITALHVAAEYGQVCGAGYFLELGLSELNAGTAWIEGFELNPSHDVVV